jgi:hypothetical protein
MGAALMAGQLGINQAQASLDTIKPAIDAVDPRVYRREFGRHDPEALLDHGKALLEDRLALVEIAQAGFYLRVVSTERAQVFQHQVRHVVGHG